MPQTGPGRPGSDRRLVIVAGSGRSGTSTLTGTLATLGLHVPAPQVPSDHTNPRGFFEPQWLVDHHRGLLADSGVAVSDARPAAAAAAAAVAGAAPAREQRLRWLGDALAASPQVVLKDPRISWFLPTWCDTARRLGVGAGCVVMLRHPAAVLESKTDSYHRRPDGSRRVNDVGDVARLAGWVNVLLLVEQTTRQVPRVFVRYDDVLSDWRAAVDRVSAGLDLQLPGRDEQAEAAVDGFVDPDLRHRSGSSWTDQNDLPGRVRDLADETWRLLDDLGRDPPAGTDCAAPFDGLRATYDEMYGESERIVGFSLRAARRSSGRGRPTPSGA